jgi:haloacetate dehalogenase
VVVTRDGVRIHYRRAGHGPGMVLLHGFPQTGHCWRKVMPALAQRWTVLAADLRGYGDSDKPRTGYDKRTMAADIADLVRGLGLGPVVLVGHDRGARVAHRYALDHPGLLTHLVLLDIAPTLEIFERMDGVNARARWHWLFHLVPELPEALVTGREEVYLRFLFRSWAHDPSAIEEEAVQEYVRCFRQPGALRAAFDDYRAGGTIDLEQDRADRDRRVAAPTLVLWAGAQRPPQAADMLAAWKDRCQYVEGGAVPGCGHFIPEEQPTALLDALTAFLRIRVQ